MKSHSHHFHSILDWFYFWWHHGQLSYQLRQVLVVEIAPFLVTFVSLGQHVKHCWKSTKVCHWRWNDCFYDLCYVQDSTIFWGKGTMLFMKKCPLTLLLSFGSHSIAQITHQGLVSGEGQIDGKRNSSCQSSPKSDWVTWQSISSCATAV